MFYSVLATLEKNTVLVITVDTELLAAVPSSFVIPWAVAHQAPLSIGFPKQEYWNGLPFPSPGDLSNPGIEPASPALEADSLPLSHHWTHWGREGWP